MDDTAVWGAAQKRGWLTGATERDVCAGFPTMCHSPRLLYTPRVLPECLRPESS